VEKIESIRIHHVSGLNGAPGTGGAGGANGGGQDGAGRPPINQVLDSILGMAVQLPALKSIGESIGYDFSTALPKASETREERKDKK
jgi:hypothetical protein